MPFEVMLVFASNLSPSGLGDEAFFRRIRHKIKIDDPDEEMFRQILRQAAKKAGLEYHSDGEEYLINLYRAASRPFRGVHGRDMVDLILDMAKFRRQKPHFTREWIDLACRSYFMED